MVKLVPSSRTSLGPPGEGGRPAFPKALEFIKNEDLQQMGLALELFDLRLLTTWAGWLSPGHWGFHLGIAAGNLIQVGFQVQGWRESTSLSSTALLCWLEEGLCNPAL